MPMQNIYTIQANWPPKRKTLSIGFTACSCAGFSQFLGCAVEVFRKRQPTDKFVWTRKKVGICWKLKTHDQSLPGE